MTKFGAFTRKLVVRSDRKQEEPTPAMITLEPKVLSASRPEVTSTFGFREEDSIYEEKRLSQTQFDQSTRSENAISGPEIQLSSSPNPNRSRFSQRLSTALKNPQHSRKSSDLTELLCEAAASGNTQFIGRILGAGGQWDKKNADGLLPLHVAVMAGQNDSVRVLVRMGADIEAKDSQGYTPVHRAVLSNRVGLIAHLANLGADINGLDSNGRTGLHIAAERNSDGLALPIQSLSRPESQNSTLRFSYVFNNPQGHRRRPSAMSTRSVYDDCTVIEALVRAGANIGLRNKEGDTALHIAVRCGSVENTTLLLDQGANINASNKSGLTALAVLAAADQSNQEVSTLLLNRGAEITSLQPEKKKRTSIFRKSAL